MFDGLSPKPLVGSHDSSAHSKYKVPRIPVKY